MPPKICKTHGKEFKLRDGQYGQFYSHIINPEGDLKGKENYHNVKAADIASEIREEDWMEAKPAPAQESRESLKERDYDAENRGKVRNNLVEALVGFQGLKSLDEQDKTIINELVSYIMTGK